MPVNFQTGTRAGQRFMIAGLWGTDGPCRRAMVVRISGICTLDQCRDFLWQCTPWRVCNGAKFFDIDNVNIQTTGFLIVPGMKCPLILHLISQNMQWLFTCEYDWYVLSHCLATFNRLYEEKRFMMRLDPPYSGIDEDDETFVEADRIFPPESWSTLHTMIL